MLRTDTALAKRRPVGGGTDRLVRLANIVTPWAPAPLALLALLLWLVSTHVVEVGRLTDLGLVAVLPAADFIALGILALSFCLSMALPQVRYREATVLVELVILVFMLYGLPTLMETQARFFVVYRHAGYTEYIMRTGTVDPRLDAYFNWPGFFIFAAFITEGVGFSSVLQFAAWAPVAYNLLYLTAVYMLLAGLTRDRRVIWLGLWLFALANWIGQDYFSPQGLDLFFYLLVIAILLRWFKRAPSRFAAHPIDDDLRSGAEHDLAELKLKLNAARDIAEGDPQRAQAILGSVIADVSQSVERLGELVRSPRWRLFGADPVWYRRLKVWLQPPDPIRVEASRWKRIGAMATLVLIFAAVVPSHPLTPFFTLASVTALVVFNRITPRTLPIVMALMTAAWIYFMAQAYLAGHLGDVTGTVGRVDQNLSSNVADRLRGSVEHIFVIRMRLAITAVIGLLAVVGCGRRLRAGRWDLTVVLLTVAALPLLALQNYGGEMVLRIYFFALAPIAFFGASAFLPRRASAISLRAAALIGATSLFLIVGFLITRYGNERADYITSAELGAVQHLYSAAPSGSSIFATGYVPWKFQGFEQYHYVDIPAAFLRETDVTSLLTLMKKEKGRGAYFLYTRSENAAINLFGEVLPPSLSSTAPPGSLERLVKAMVSSGKFRILYQNADGQILVPA